MQFNYEYIHILIQICQFIELLEEKYWPVFNIDI